MEPQAFPSITDVFGPFLVSAFILIFVVIIRGFKEKQRINRANSAREMAESFNGIFLEHFNNLFEDCRGLELFVSKGRNRFSSVIKFNDESKGRLYIGEWTTEQTAGKEKSAFSGNRDGNIVESATAEVYTLGVVYDKSFNLPGFTMWPESFADKASELINAASSQDIDFEEDTTFSNAWWLCSNINPEAARELFSEKEVRDKSLKFAAQGYRLAGLGNTLIIVCPKVIPVKAYPDLLSEIDYYKDFLRINKKFYKENSF